MPRKIDLKSNRDVVFEREPVPFSAAEQQALFQPFGSDPESSDRIIAALEAIAAAYVREYRQEAGSAGASACNAALRSIANLAQQAEEAPAMAGQQSLDLALAGLNSEADWSLRLQLRRARPDLDPAAGYSWASYLPREIAEAALAALIPGNGRRRDVPLAVAVDRLVRVYEDFTGRRATHTPSLAGVYDGSPHSEAGRFIETFFGILRRRDLAPALPPSGMSSALLGVIHARRR